MLIRNYVIPGPAVKPRDDAVPVDLISKRVWMYLWPRSGVSLAVSIMQNKHDFKSKIVIFIGVALLTQTVTANAGVINILINLQSSLWPMWKLMNGFAYLLGIGFFFKALYHLKIYGELRTMMASQTSLKQPLTYMAVGLAFIYLPTTISIALTSTYGDGNIMPYAKWTGSSEKYGEEGMKAIFTFIQFVGGIAFIRGLLILTKSVQQGAQKQFGKAMTHIFGGIMGLNIVATANILQASFGVNFFAK